jgi:hypothetical protein
MCRAIESLFELLLGLTVGIVSVEIELLQHNLCLARHGLDVKLLVEARDGKQVQNLGNVLR